MVRVAMVMFEKMGQWLAGLEGDEGQEDVARERQIERRVGFAMAVAVFLPGTGVAFVVVAVFHRPVLANGVCRTRFFVDGEAGEEEAGVAFGRLVRVFLLRPIAPDRDGRAGARQPGVDGSNGGDGGPTPIQRFAPFASFPMSSTAINAPTVSSIRSNAWRLYVR